MLNRVAAVLGVLALWCTVGVAEEPAAKELSATESGPESGGLRLRFDVTPNDDSRRIGYEVRLALVNASTEKITLRTGWESTEDGDVKDYLREMANIETYPAFEPEHGGSPAQERRTKPQKELTLAPGETLALEYRTHGQKLKNPVTSISALFSHNPTFTEHGLYSVHVTLDVITTSGTHRLRSNEQLVSIGRSKKMPKHTYGQLTSVGSRGQGQFSLGQRHGVKVGDQFAITSKTGSWRLTVAETYANFSEVTIAAVGDEGTSLPQAGAGATLIHLE